MSAALKDLFPLLSSLRKHISTPSASAVMNHLRFRSLDPNPIFPHSVITRSSTSMASVLAIFSNMS